MQEEYNTNHPDKDERKKARRKRIEKRHEEEARDLGEGSDKMSGADRTGAQQVSDSMLHLDRRKHTGLEQVTSLRVKSDVEENKRRVEEEDVRKDRLGKLQGEAFGSAKANAAIEMRWAELLEKEIPQELHEDMQSQLEACTEVIRSKDELIANFQRQLRAKDEEYVRALRQQSEDVAGLLVRIRAEVRVFLCVKCAGFIWVFICVPACVRLCFSRTHTNPPPLTLSLSLTHTHTHSLPSCKASTRKSY